MFSMKRPRGLSLVKTAVVTVNKVKYLVNARGRALTGWRELNGKMYYADKRGKCAAGTTVEGIKFNKNGYDTGTV